MSRGKFEISVFTLAALSLPLSACENPTLFRGVGLGQSADAARVALSESGFETPQGSRDGFTILKPGCQTSPPSIPPDDCIMGGVSIGNEKVTEIWLKDTFFNGEAADIRLFLSSLKREYSLSEPELTTPEDGCPRYYARTPRAEHVIVTDCPYGKHVLVTAERHWSLPQF